MTHLTTVLVSLTDMKPHDTAGLDLYYSQLQGWCRARVDVRSTDNSQCDLFSDYLHRFTRNATQLNKKHKLMYDTSVCPSHTSQRISRWRMYSWPLTVWKVIVPAHWSVNAQSTPAVLGPAASRIIGPWHQNINTTCPQSHSCNCNEFILCLLLKDRGRTS